MYDYDTTHGGQFLTITDDEGRSCFLQGDDAAALADELEAAETDEAVQAILSAYADVLE